MAELLESVPYLLAARLALPLRVVNDVPRRGFQDAGMSGGCTWRPFAIGESEWGDLARDLETRASGQRCQFVEPPDWVLRLYGRRCGSSRDPIGRDHRRHAPNRLACARHEVRVTARRFTGSVGKGTAERSVRCSEVR